VYDLYAQLIICLAVIVGRLLVLTEPENIVWLIAPFTTGILGLTLYNYLIMYE
jgi:hypothetical protein